MATNLAETTNRRFRQQAANLAAAAGANPDSDVAVGDDLTVGDDATVTGDLTVTGATALNGNVAIGNATTDLCGFHGATADQAAAYTQTYSTAARTVPAEVAAITGGESPTEAEHNLVVADVLALKKVITALIDDLQEKGIVG